MDEIGAAHKSSVSAVSLAWLRSNPQLSTPIASARTVKQLEEIVQVIDLSADEVAALNKVSA
jgi:aryl-alcohol dehydrogenase-like predicted oxidoreductase